MKYSDITIPQNLTHRPPKCLQNLLVIRWLLNLHLAEGAIRDENTATPCNLAISSKAEIPFNRTCNTIEDQSVVTTVPHTHSLAVNNIGKTTTDALTGL